MLFWINRSFSPFSIWPLWDSQRLTLRQMKVKHSSKTCSWLIKTGCSSWNKRWSQNAFWFNFSSIWHSDHSSLYNFFDFRILKMFLFSDPNPSGDLQSRFLHRIHHPYLYWEDWVMIRSNALQRELWKLFLNNSISFWIDLYQIKNC